MITILYFLAGYLIIGFLIGQWMQKYVSDSEMNPDKITTKEVMVFSALCWLPLILIGILFPNVFEEK